MWFLNRFGPGHHRVEVDEFAVILGLALSPDLLHGFDPFLHQLMPGFEIGAVVLHFIRFQPLPIPNRKRPSLMRSMEATDFAV